MRILLLFFLALGLSACGSQISGLDGSAEKAMDQIACENSDSALFDVIYESLTVLKQDPSAKDLKPIFQNALKNKKNLEKHETEILDLTNEFYSILEKIPADNLYEKLKKVSAAEIGLQTTTEEISNLKKITAFQSKWKNLAAKLDNTTCPPGIRIPPENGESISTAVSPVAFGARRALATAYQSCSSIDKKPLNTNTENVKGITITGMHSDGVGSKRVISDLDALMATNYYYQGVNQGSSCKDIRKFPLIYDYGGKPNTDSGTLNFFVNSGDGTSVLGIDCSGYVFSAIATSGLRLAPGKTVKPSYVHILGSSAYLNPDSNGLQCFAKVKMGVSGTLKQGDIAAVNGHVFIVDSVGADPMGINNANQLSDCDNLSVDNFDFVIIQSSNSKEGIGINKFEARDYLPTSDKMRVGFMKYARDACRARISGTNPQMTATNFQIIRHKMTAECKSSTRISMAGESCVSQCAALAVR